VIQHIWSIVCKESRVDETTNSISIIDAYENLQISLNTEPDYKEGSPVGVPLNFELVSLFYRDKKAGEESIEEFVRVIDPKGLELGGLSSKVVFKDSFDRMRNIFKFQSIALTTSGTYLFQLYSQKTKKGKKQLISVIPVSIRVTINSKIS